MIELSHEEELRYNRQIILKSVDFDGQEKLKASKMLIVGLGGLGMCSQPISRSSRCWKFNAVGFRHSFSFESSTTSLALRCSFEYAQSGVS